MLSFLFLSQILGLNHFQGEMVNRELEKLALSKVPDWPASLKGDDLVLRPLREEGKCLHIILQRQ